ncbi:MAG: protein kinase family protein [Prevotella sp.]|nr:protein kinase family protein [Prevotella sp.]
MNYPLISEYIEAIKSAEDNFEELSYLRPVLGADRLPVMTGGNFAEVFKMKDVKTGKFYAIKCFTKEQKGRAEAYRQISEELKNVSSPYLTNVQYLEKELFVDTDQTKETEFPVLLMDWVDGKTLDKYLRENLGNQYALEMLAYRFSQLAQWLLPQPFAHGDLKPDNIIVREDGTLVLVDYDGMFVPAMRGQRARELGSPDFRHPLRNENVFDQCIDDFPVMSILVSLVGISKYPDLLSKYGAPDRLLFSKTDYVNIDQQKVIKELFLTNDESLRTLICVFTALCHHRFPISIPTLEKPFKTGTIEGYLIKGVDILSEFSIKKPQHPITINQVIDGLKQLDDLMRANGIDYVLTGSLGLYMHGLVPASYIPHDIDIIISSNKNKHPFLTNQMILDLFCQYSGGDRPEYAYYDASDMFIFYLGKNKLEINAFVDVNKVFERMDYLIMNIMGSDIKVNNALSIFREKFKMRRQKDLQFNNDIQLRLNSYLENKQSEEFEKFYNKMILTDKIRDFLTGINYGMGQSETKLLSVLFNEETKMIWLPKSLWDKCIIQFTSWNNTMGALDAIIFGIKGDFTKITRLDSSKRIEGWFKRDVSYMVDLLYYVLSEMGIVDYFAMHIAELTIAINEHEKPVEYDPDDLPF